MKPSQDAMFFDQKLQDPKYWNMLWIEHGMDTVVEKLKSLLPVWSEIFEYGAGRWRNAIPLSENWNQVTAQDIVQRAVTDLMEMARSKNICINPLVWDAREVKHDKSYDAFVIIRMLHFLPKREAISVIQNMKTHTKVGGYNACVVFSEDLAKDKGFYFPTREEFLEQYTWWKIIFEDTKIKKMTEWREMPRFSMLLQRVE